MLSLLSSTRERQLYRIESLHPSVLTLDSCESYGKHSSETIDKFLGENVNPARLDY